MIIIQLIGGIGNQMFQYAMGRSIALRNNTNLKLDISLFKQYQLRSYRLECFNIIEEFATHEEIKHLKPGHDQLLFFCLSKVQQKFIPWHNRDIIFERTMSFNPAVLKITDDAYIEGYWQSEKYFKHISHTIHNDFKFKREPDRINKDFLSIINETNSVSLHIRRGDYISNKKTREILGFLGIDYYIRALNLIIKKVNKPNFFIFSDDIPWARENIKADFPFHFIEHNGADKEYEDLRLMSNCKHHIIANSSFSWWGAWLGSNPKKIIISPKKWFNQLKMDIHDLIPDSWIQI